MSPEHKAYLKSIFVPVIALSRSRFSESEVLLLLKYGSWYSALQSGKLKPVTMAQKRFVGCLAGDAVPTTVHEIVWTRYIQALQDASTSSKNVGVASEDGAWNRSAYDEIIAAQKAKQDDKASRPHQFTGGVVDEGNDNYDSSAIH